MAKQRSIFVCQNCGAQSPKWMGRCPECDAWNSLSPRRRRSRSEAATVRVRGLIRGLGRGEAKAVRFNDTPLKPRETKRVGTRALANSTGFWAAAWWPEASALLAAILESASPRLCFKRCRIWLEPVKKFCTSLAKESVSQTQIGRASPGRFVGQSCFSPAKPTWTAILKLTDELRTFSTSSSILFKLFFCRTSIGAGLREPGARVRGQTYVSRQDRGSFCFLGGPYHQRREHRRSQGFGAHGGHRFEF